MSGGITRGALFIWRSKWNLLRLVLAVFVLWVLAADTSSRLSRRALSMLPDFDYATEVRALRLEGRYGEALVVAESGLRGVEGEARQGLVTERDLAKAERDSVLRRFKDAGMGALSGRADTLEGLLGAIGADLFIIGDIRDLVIEGGKQVLDGESDEVILLLSAAGIATTLLPEIDWAPSLLKAARRMGAMSDRFAGTLVRMLKARDARALEPVLRDTVALAGRASPAGAVRILKHADSPDDLAVLASFVKRHPDGAGAMHVGGRGSADLLKVSAREGAEATARAERALLDAARKGPRGVRFVTDGPGRALLRPHPLLTLVKSVYKGNAAALLTRALDRFDHAAWWMIPASAAWVLIEIGLLVRRAKMLRVEKVGPVPGGRRAPRPIS